MGGGQGAKSEASATRLQKHKKKTRQPKLEVLASGWRQGTKLEASATRLQKAQKAQEAQDSKVGGQSSGWRPKFRLENPLQSCEAYLQNCRVV